MRLERIELRNFRCYEDFALELGGQSVLVIGSNASGKTSLLAAIRSALNGGTLDVRDLRDRSKPAELIATVSGIPAAAQGDFADAVDITTTPPTVRVGLRAKWDVQEERLELTHGFPDAAWRGMRRSAREHLRVIWLPAWRDPNWLAAMTGRSSLLAQLVADLDLTQPIADAVSTMTRASQEFAHSGPFYDLLGELGDELARLLPKVVPQAFDLGTDVAQPADILGQLALIVGHRGPPAPVASQSGGVVQAAIFALAIKTLKAEPDALLLVDEPEVALHPHAQRAVVNALRAAAGQSIISTHTAAVLDRADPRHVVRIRRGVNGGTENVRATGLSESEAHKVRRYATSLTAEAYFAETVMLVEGFSDLLAVRALATKLEINLDALGVSVISLEGADLIPHYLKLIGPPGLDLELRGLCDADRERKWLRHLENAGLPVTDVLSMERAGFHVCRPDLETELTSALTEAEIDAVIDGDGALADLHAFAADPAYRSMSPIDQRLSFTKRNKIRWVPLIADAIAADAVPQPIRDLLEDL